ncbi:type VI secretion system baseplate subunit TssG [Roseiconus lacunae]|uniref:Type VI secretion system baseplate subunit TssG n=2 Tax=Roseiconus lacunae TaxID=2605694 RepID=A0ABT7PI24_9BACT|nr:type VI secretion system baseplate subunit TssG [Roseiconus lacunae]MDM4016146.1 type VI secretion system baseplate subunit TssG [Roseiconus lacunae]
MAGAVGKTRISVKQRLMREPYKFTFFQAVRLLLAAPSATRSDAHSQHQPAGPKRAGRIGTVSNINEEPVRFQVQPALRFAPSEVISVNPHQDAETDKVTEGLVEMLVSFWGLTGPAGALPTQYTQLVIDRVHAKDQAMRSFFDMFSHRQLSFFYRAWEKYSLAAGYETSAQRQRPEADLIRETLLSIVGRGTDQVRDRLQVTDDALIYYGGVFNDRPTAESLRAIVSDYLGLPAKVLSMFGQWLVLPPAECSRLGSTGAHCIVGLDTILGGRTWDPGSKFRIQIGPVRFKDFTRLLPTGQTLPQVCQFIRSYVGMEFDFDLQVILMADEIPACRFVASGSTQDGSSAPHLGWNTWLCSRPPTHDSADAVFHHDGTPTR